MIKELFINQFPENIFYEASKIYDLWELSKEYDIITYSNEFYTPNIWRKISNKIDGIVIDTNGIFSESDRRQIAFIPKKYGKEELNFPNKLLKIKVNSKFKEYKHKDFLGSLMGLKLKRELMGDLILINEYGYIPVSDKIVDIIIQDLKLIGKNTCKIEILDKRDLKNIPSYKYDSKVISVNSKRLDNIISSILNISRSKVVEKIEKGDILIDYNEEKNKSKILEIGTIITIKGYGKVKLFDESGVSKKGKEKLIVKKYV